MIQQKNHSKKIAKYLSFRLVKKAGRANNGQITSRHQSGGHKKFYRIIDFKRDKLGMNGEVVALEYDPNRNVRIAMIQYRDGEKRYILSPVGLHIGDSVISGKDVEPKTGNAMPLAQVPIGTPIHNIELQPGTGGKLIRGAGGMATVLAVDSGFAQVKLPSGELRMIPQTCYATIGQLSNPEWKDTPIGKAGRARHMGRRPKVRGTAQNPRSHPHGGGEGRSGEGLKQPKTPWGKPARGLKTRKKGKYSDIYIIKKRK